MYIKQHKISRKHANPVETPATNQLLPNQSVYHEPVKNEQNLTTDIQAKTDEAIPLNDGFIDGAVFSRQVTRPEPRGIQMKPRKMVNGSNHEPEGESRVVDVVQPINGVQNESIQRVEIPKSEDELQKQSIVQRTPTPTTNSTTSTSTTNSTTPTSTTNSTTPTSTTNSTTPTSTTNSTTPTSTTNSTTPTSTTNSTTSTSTTNSSAAPADLKSKLASIIAGTPNYAAIKIEIQAASATDKNAALADQTLLTSLQGALSWNDFAKSVELLGRQAPDYNTLIADATVQNALTVAWTNSNPAIPGPGTTQHEEGGWIYRDPITGNLSVKNQTSGGQAAINLSSPPRVTNSIVVGKFHTHPNLGPNWVHGPSPGDTTVDAQHGVPDIVVASPNPPAQTYYLSGPAQRLHLAGNQELPGSGGGAAPQAKKDGSHDEQ